MKIKMFFIPLATLLCLPPFRRTSSFRVKGGSLRHLQSLGEGRRREKIPK